MWLYASLVDGFGEIDPIKYNILSSIELLSLNSESTINLEFAKAIPS